MAERWRGPLHGVPVAFKDLCHLAGQPTSCGTKTAEYFLAEHDCTAARRLLDAGAVGLGKLNMSELASGPFGDNAHHGDVAEPLAGRALLRRLVERLRRGGRGGPGVGRDRHRYRRLHPPARRVLRRRRHQAHVRARQPRRRDGAVVVARSRRAAGPDGAGRRAAARRHGGPGRSRRHDEPSARAGLRRRARRRGPWPARGRARGVLLRPHRPRDGRGRPRRGPRAGRARRARREHSHPRSDGTRRRGQRHQPRRGRGHPRPPA